MMVTRRLGKFHQNPPGALGMNKCNLCSTSTYFGRFINQTNSAPLEILDSRLDVFHAKTDMMQTFAFLGDESADRAIFAERLKKLDMSVAYIQLCYLYPLLFHCLDLEQLQP